VALPLSIGCPVALRLQASAYAIELSESRLAVFPTVRNKAPGKRGELQNRRTANRTTAIRGRTGLAVLYMPEGRLRRKLQLVVIR
jgi:hypothetical protein